MSYANSRYFLRNKFLLPIEYFMNNKNYTYLDDQSYSDEFHFIFYASVFINFIFYIFIPVHDKALVKHFWFINIIIAALYYIFLTDKEDYKHYCITKLFFHPINNLVGILIFGKTNSSRNYPRWDIILFRIALPALSLVFVTYASDISLETKKGIYTFIGGFYGITCWHIYNRKSNQFSTAYSAALDFMKDKTDFSSELIEVRNMYGDTLGRLYSNTIRKELFGSSLAIDLIHFDLWNHKSFSTFFRSHLTKVLKHFNKESEMKYNKLLVTEVKHNLINYHKELNHIIDSIEKRDFLYIDIKSLFEKLLVPVKKEMTFVKKNSQKKSFNFRSNQ